MTPQSRSGMVGIAQLELMLLFNLETCATLNL
jgi:hypothetical protein